jgi:hypothetical protein
MEGEWRKWRGGNRERDAFYKGETETLKVPRPYPLVFW